MCHLFEVYLFTVKSVFVLFPVAEEVELKVACFIHISFFSDLYVCTIYIFPLDFQLETMQEAMSINSKDKQVITAAVRNSHQSGKCTITFSCCMCVDFSFEIPSLILFFCFFLPF